MTDRIEALASATQRVLDAKRWSLRHAERQTGVSYSTVYNLTEGRRVSADLLARWATAIGESPADWLRLAGYEDLANLATHPASAPANVPELTREPVFDDLAQAGYSDLPPDEREDIIALVKAKLERIKRNRG